MANTRGIFTLSQVQTKQRYGEFVPSSDVFTQRPEAPLPDIGYNTGGYSGGSAQSSTTKLTFSNDTFAAAPTASLLVPRGEGQAAGNDTKGYIMGGIPPATSAARLTYATDTTVGVPGADLPTPGQHRGASGGSTTNGYFSGGNGPGLNPCSNVNRLVYASETSSRIPGMDLTGARAYATGAGNDTIGYVHGQQYPGNTNVSSCMKQTYSTETTTAAPSNADLSGVRYRTGGGGTSVAGYFAGGNPGGLTTVDRITIATDTRATLPASASLEEGRAASATTGNNSTGYFMAGNLPGSVASNADKLVYATDTMSTTTSNMPGTRYRSMGLGPKRMGLPQNETFPFVQLSTGNQITAPNTGYVITGRDPAAPTPGTMSIVDKIDFSTDTLSAVGNTPNPSDNHAVMNSSTAIYSGGGYPSQLASTQSTIYKTVYSTDTTDGAPYKNLTQAKWAAGGLSSEINGYISGGGPGFSDTDRLIFSSDSIARIPSADVPIPGGYRAGTAGNTAKGYFLMANNDPRQGGVYKLDYSTDFYSSLPITTFPDRGAASIAAGDMKSLVVSTFSITNFQRLVYSTETGSSLPSSPKPHWQWQLMGASSNSDGAYFSGGYYPSIGGQKSNTLKLSYATDTNSIIPSASLSAGRYATTGGGARSSGTPMPPYATPTPQNAALRSSTYGYYVPNAGYVSDIFKFSFASETFSDSGTDISAARNYTCAGGNTTHGYIFAGSNKSTIDKYTYATDTAQANSNDMTFTTQQAACLVSTTDDYVCGGFQESTSEGSRIDKFTFSSETAALLPSTLPTALRYFRGVSDINKAGYTLGGSPTTSIVQKIAYSGDSLSLVPGMGLPIPIRNVSSSSKERTGYCIGGRDVSSNVLSSTSKISLISETSSSAPAATLTFQLEHAAAFSDNTNLYVTGGVTVPVAYPTSTHKISYSNDTASLVPGALSKEGQGASAQSNAEYGIQGNTAPVIC